MPMSSGSWLACRGWVLGHPWMGGVHCRMPIASLASLPVPCEKHPPQLWGAKMSLDTASCSLGDEIVPMGEPLPSMDSSIKKQM